MDNGKSLTIIVSFRNGSQTVDIRVWLHNGTLQNGNVTKRYVLQNGTRYNTVRVTKRYSLQNGTRYKTVTLQNGTCYKTVRYKTVHFYTVL